jgi:hypothetical protein
MKKTLLTLALVGATAAAFGQGRVAMVLDGGSAITLSALPGYYLPADAAFAGMQVPTSGPLPSGSILMVGLYCGTSSTSLALQYAEALNPAGGTGQPPGVILAHNVQLASGLPGAVAAYFFQLRIWSGAYSSYEAASTAIAGGAMEYAGENNLFTMTPGTFIYNAITTQGGTTWAAVGNESTTAFNLTAYNVPEPATFALFGLGAASLLILRRRK